MPQSDFPKAVIAKENAERMRDMALVKVKELCETGQRHRVMNFLLALMRRHPELGKIRLWRIDATIFGTSRKRAVKMVRKMRDFIHDDSNAHDGMCNLAWATESPEKIIRLDTWLYMLLLREHIVEPERPDDWPFGLLYEPDSQQ